MTKLFSSIVGAIVVSASTAHSQPSVPPPPPPPVPSTAPVPPMPAEPPPGPVYAPAPPVYDSQAPAYAPPAPPALYAAPTAGYDAGVMEDANADRALLAPSAITPPQGTFTFNNYELFWLSASYSPTDNLQLTAGTIIPIEKSVPFIGTLGAKLQILHQDRLRVALHGFVAGGSDSGSRAAAGVVGGALTYCVDDSCHSRINGYLGAGFASDGGAATPILASASGVFRLSRLVRGVVEVDTGYIAGDFSNTSNSFLFNYAVRFTSANIGVDFGFLKLFVDGEDAFDILPLGVPFLSFTYRGGSRF